MKNMPSDTIEDINLDFDIESAPASEADAEPESYEQETGKEISEVLAAFKQRAKDEAEQKRRNTTTDYWFAVYFATQEQRDVFLRAMNLLEKMDAQYIDGITFADACGVEVSQDEITVPKAFRRPANIDGLVMEISDLNIDC